MNTESPGRALLVAAVIAVGCSALVASAVHWLRPLQPATADVERVRTILDVAGRLPVGDPTDAELLAAFEALEARVIRLPGGEPVEVDDAHSYDHWTQAGEGDTTELGQAPVYLVRRGRALERVVFPVHGPGMWSTIQGYVALAADLASVADLAILRHGETPGVGDRIEQASWRAEWRGKRVYGPDGTPRIDVVQNARSEYEVDLISGASVTCEAVGDFVRKSFGPDGYGPFVSRLAQEER